LNFLATIIYIFIIINILFLLESTKFVFVLSRFVNYILTKLYD
jgi:hypothetical protein